MGGKVCGSGIRYQEVDTSDWKFMVCKIHRLQYQCGDKNKP